MNEIRMIPIDQLRHHPENPRKDLGDLEELTASIKANGILQNLTVVHLVREMTDDEWSELSRLYQECPTEELRQALNSREIIENERFWVVIGNRRFEAAKAAGLEELPCVVSDMDHKTQVATMLEENMQRTDLTPYEQAEGFQMMMDLGFKPKEIGEKTGFSEKTVKERLKLTKLNKKNFSDAVNQGATLVEMIEVTKLESKTAQNEVLKAAGTDNFRQKLKDALEEQERKQNQDRIKPILKEAGIDPMVENERYGSGWTEIYGTGIEIKDSDDVLRKKLKKLQKENDGPLRYYFTRWGRIEFYKKKAKEAKAPMTAEQKTERQKSIAKGKHLRHVKEFWKQAYELRKDFVKTYTVANGQGSSTLGKILIRYALNGKNEWNGKIQESHKWDDAYLREVLGLPDEPVEAPDQDPNAPSYARKYLNIWQQVDGKSDIPIVRVMLAWAVAGGVFWPDHPERGSYRYDDGTYQKGSNMENDVVRLYEFLVEIGYDLSDMEKQLLDGTHECYRMEDL